jgi:hypothetical protein
MLVRFEDLPRGQWRSPSSGMLRRIVWYIDAETSVHINQTTRCHIQEDGYFLINLVTVISKCLSVCLLWQFQVGLKSIISVGQSGEGPEK